jgi:hypothetical protein
MTLQLKVSPSVSGKKKGGSCPTYLDEGVYHIFLLCSTTPLALQLREEGLPGILDEERDDERAETLTNGLVLVLHGGTIWKQRSYCQLCVKGCVEARTVPYERAHVGHTHPLGHVCALRTRRDTHPVHCGLARLVSSNSRLTWEAGDVVHWWASSGRRVPRVAQLHYQRTENPSDDKHLIR